MKAVLLAVALAGPVSAETVRFIACPIYRDVDAGRKSGCWLADDRGSGRRFDVSRGPSKPDWSHELLVEGVVAPPGPDRCGGIVLDPVRTSVLEGACTRHSLPGEGFAGNRFALPRRTVAPLSVARAAPTPPFTDRTFHLFFDFDRAFLVYQYDDWLLDRAATLIRGVPLRRVTVTGWAATRADMVSDRRLTEPAAIARARAGIVGEALRRLGVPADRLAVRWRTGARPIDDPEADGLSDPSRRRADIRVEVAR